MIAEGECQLNRQRRVAPQMRKREADEGERVVRQRFGVDRRHLHRRSLLHPPFRLPLADAQAESPNPLRPEPVAHVDNSCVGCGVCGEVAHAAVLCPSFYRADVVTNPAALGAVASMRSGGESSAG